MSKLSILALLAAACAFSAPVHAQEISASAEVGASPQVSAGAQTDPTAGVEVSAEASTPAGPQEQVDAPSVEASAPADDGAAARLDIDSSLGIEISAAEAGQIRDAVVRAGIQPVDPGFDVVIGAKVPSSVTLSSVPAGLVQVIPGFRGYLCFVLPDGRIAVVAPTSLRVVLVLYA